MYVLYVHCTCCKENMRSWKSTICVNHKSEFTYRVNIVCVLAVCMVYAFRTLIFYHFLVEFDVCLQSANRTVKTVIHQECVKSATLDIFWNQIILARVSWISHFFIFISKSRICFVLFYNITEIFLQTV